jgi:hypothetical protein
LGPEDANSSRRRIALKAEREEAEGLAPLNLKRRITMPKPREEWRVEEHEDVMICKVYGPTHADGYEFAPIFETSDKATARKVVLAVNAHTELLNAVKIAIWIRNAIRERKESGYSDATFGATFEEWDDLEAVIKKAEGE